MDQMHGTYGESFGIFVDALQTKGRLLMQGSGRSTSWETTLTPGATLERAEAELQRAGGRRVEPQGAETEYAFGKPVSWRLWGMWGFGPERRIPFSVVLRAQPGDRGSRLDLRAETMTRGYVVEIPGVARLLDLAVAPIIESINSAFAGDAIEG